MLRHLSKIELLVATLVVIIALMCGHSVVLQRERHTMLSNMKATYDTDGVDGLSKMEFQTLLTKLLKKKLNPNTAATPKDDKRAEQLASVLMGIYDTDGDELLNNDDLFKIYDILDELPSSVTSKELLLLGGDFMESEMVITVVLALLAAGILVILWQEAILSARALSRTEAKLRASTANVDDLQADIIKLEEEEGEIRASELGGGGSRSSISKSMSSMSSSSSSSSSSSTDSSSSSGSVSRMRTRSSSKDQELPARVVKQASRFVKSLSRKQRIDRLEEIEEEIRNKREAIKVRRSVGRSVGRSVRQQAR